MTPDEQKAARLAAALRANLAKRKAQKRARAEPAAAGADDHAPATDAAASGAPGSDAPRESGEG